MPSLSNSSAGQMSTMTWGQAKNTIAQVVGGQDDSDALQAAEDALSTIFEDWNTRRNWQFLQVQADDIAVVSGTNTYDLPTAFKKPYSAMLVNSPRVLWYTTRREYNRMRPSQSFVAYPTHYTLFNVASTGKIELIPSCGVNEVLRVWYYRLMSERGEDDDLLDTLGRYTTYMLDAAKARLLGIRGPTEKLPFWQGQAEAGFAKAQADDEGIPDEDTGFVPGGMMYGPPSDNSFMWVDWGW